MFRRKPSLARIIASSNLRVCLLAVAIAVALVLPPLDAAHSAILIAGDVPATVCPTQMLDL